MVKQFTLGKNERMKSRKAIDELFSKGKSIIVSPFRAVYLPAGKGIKFGVGVSAKNFKKATDRNRIKRITKEAYRLQKKSLQELLRLQNKGLNVFFTYTSKELTGYKEISDAVEKIVTKLMKTINETGTSNT